MKYYKRIDGHDNDYVKINHIYEILELSNIGYDVLKINDKHYNLSYFQEVTKLDYDVYDYIIRLINHHINYKLELNDLNVRKYIKYAPTTTYNDWINLLPNGELEDKLKLIHLICLVTFKMRDKEKDIKSKEVLERLMGIKLDVSKDGYTNYLIGLSLLCDDLLFEITEISTLGYTNSNDIINEIKRLIDGWIPF